MTDQPGTDLHPPKISIAADFGSMLSFEVPADWADSERRPVVGGRHLRKLMLSSNAAVRFCHYLRTVTLSRPATDAFQKVIYSEFHRLTTSEIDSLAEVLEGMSNKEKFELAQADTGYVNGRRVLRVQGSWRELKEQTMCIFVDVEGDGSTVEQIYFTAPQELFSHFASTAETIFESIKWKRV
jgi:hypothetical protein